MKDRKLLLPLLAGTAFLASCSTSLETLRPPIPRGERADADAKRKSVGPNSDQSPLPWNLPAKGQGGGVLGAMPKERDRRSSDTRPAQERPGLATGYGPTIDSPWDRQSFVRASSGPAGTAVIYYNDREGVEAMSAYSSSDDSIHQVAGGLADWGIKGGFGFLPARSNYQRAFVIGRRDGSYSIYLKNNCRSRLEFVLSVDGLDVIDGKTASYAKRGYVVAPGKTLEVKGWRTSPDTVARFTFSTVAGSYSNLAHGETRNVGVIGMAVFTEKGVDPWKWMPNEIDARETASPFAKSP